MSSHDCRVSGSVTIRRDVTENAVEEALKAFLDHIGSTFEAEAEKGNIELVKGELFLSLDFYGMGGYQNDDIDQLVEELTKIADGPNWVEVTDFDTGSDDERCKPEFIGSESDKVIGRLRYGIAQMADWVRPIIGDALFAAICEQIERSPRHDPKAG